MATTTNVVAVKPTEKNTAKIGAIMLAAGFSRRFGSIKLNAVLPSGKSVLQQSMFNLSRSISDIILVTRQDLVESNVLQPLQHEKCLYQQVLCPDAENGMGHTLACGIQAIPADWDACLICLGDMPFISPVTLQQLVNAATHNNIIVPVYQEQRGHPICFGKFFFPALNQCSGDAGARALINQHKHQITELNTNDPGILKDIDTPEDLDVE